MKAVVPDIYLPYEVILYLFSRIPRTSEKAERFFKFHDYLKPLLEKAEKLRDSPLPSSYDKTSLYPIDKEVIEASLLFLSRDDRIKLCAYFDPLLDICKELFPEDIHLFSVPEELIPFPEEEYPVVPRRPISPPRRRTPRYYKPREQIRYPERPLSPPRESSRRPSYHYEEERVSRPTTLRETLRPSYRYEEERVSRPTTLRETLRPSYRYEEERVSRPTILRETLRPSYRYEEERVSRPTILRETLRPSYRYEEERVSRPTILRETLRPSYRYEEERLPPPPSYPPPPPPVEPSEGERISRPTTLRGTPQRTSRLPRIPLSAVYPRK